MGYLKRKREKKAKRKARLKELSLRRRFWVEWVRPVGTVVITLSLFRSAVADWNDVPTGSMKPTIMEGDRILVDKTAYGLRTPFTLHWLARWDAPEHGQIVVLFSPADGTRLVKRVVGVPGDTLEIKNGWVYINGSRCEYEPLAAAHEAALLEGVDRAEIRRLREESFSGEAPHPVMHFTRPGRFAPRDFGPVTIPPRSYFVMGDNRDESGDSRKFGFVHQDRIVGRSSAVAISVDPQRHYFPRWRRFFKPLP